ncbi:MAG: NAD(P)-dependent glycerol-3-phosphate dehydrogenase [Coriobacteriales bacterium]|jgi:glycerol-3-phosphate dehydrogenase (NAD(P)+)|nr:NAD(P)-dependent glycerol-3-phosphate dehydrogenase [Coriobacteriales bacterium]
MNISVIGAGSWGSAIAWLLGEGEHRVRLWARSPEVAEAINREHRNPRYIPTVLLPASLVATASLAEALSGADAVVLATPSSAVRTVAEAMAAVLGEDGTGSATPLLLLAKGLEIAPPPAPEEHKGDVPFCVPVERAANAATNVVAPAVGDVAAEHNRVRPLCAPRPHCAAATASAAQAPPKLLLDVLAEVLGAPQRLAVLSGPNHAEEVAQRMLAGTVVAAQSPDVARLFQQALATPEFRVYSSDDCVGVQLCGAAKNVIAIAAGVAAGLNLGDNLAALLMTRGLAEISRLVTACGGQSQTCMGLAGMGDLIVTCASRHSRNRAFGEALAAGVSLEDYQVRTHMVVEGALACRALPALAATKAVEMPVCEHVRSVVWDGQPLAEKVASLLERPAKPEF